MDDIKIVAIDSGKGFHLEHGWASCTIKQERVQGEDIFKIYTLGGGYFENGLEDTIYLYKVALGLLLELNSKDKHLAELTYKHLQYLVLKGRQRA